MVMRAPKATFRQIVHMLQRYERAHLMSKVGQEQRLIRQIHTADWRQKGWDDFHNNNIGRVSVPDFRGELLVRTLNEHGEQTTDERVYADLHQIRTFYGMVPSDRCTNENITYGATPHRGGGTHKHTRACCRSFDDASR